MRKNRIRLSEAQLHNIIRESVNNVINEEVEEGFWNQTKSAGSSLWGGGKGSLGQRFSNAKKNWNTQGELDGLNNLRNELTDLLNKRQISPNTTVGQIVGGSYNGGRFGTMNGMIGNRMSQISRRGGNSY